LNNENIHGAQKILLSIISGEEAELQMDELTDITEYIQEVAGNDAEVIFGHGVDPELGESIRVTLIATGFDNSISHTVKEKKTVFDLESNKQIGLFETQKPEEEEPIPVKTYTFDGFSQTTTDVEEEEEPEETEAQEKVFSWSFDTAAKPEQSEEDESENAETFRQPLQARNLSEAIENKRAMLQQQAADRINRLKGMSNPVESDNFKERLDVPAYQRKEVRLQDVPHSSEKNISKYHLNDDSQIMGQNKFLHDNVD